MTEDEWLACQKFKPMFELYCERGSDRGFRLFAAACARRVLPLVLDEFREGYLQALEAMDRYLEDQATVEALAEADPFHVCDSEPACASCVLDDALRACQTSGEECRRHAREAANQAVRSVAEKAVQATLMDRLQSLHPEMDERAWMTLHGDSPAAADYDKVEEEIRTSATISEKARQAALLRDIFGNPFRQPQSIEPHWLTWNDGAVPKLARIIYDDRRFDGLPLLADALEEAGCINADLLAHCRQGGEHERGCWILELLLGKT